MSAPADRILTNGEIHPHSSRDTVVEAVAIRNGRVVKIGDRDSVSLLAGIETDVIDCAGRVVLPGFIDAHTHLKSTGRYLVYADLSSASSRDDALHALDSEQAEHGDWLVGIGYDESTWPSADRLTRTDLDSIDEERPIAAFRVDMHTATINSAALERLGDHLPGEYIEVEAGTKTGVIFEDALGTVREDIGGEELIRELLTAAQEHALSKGVTCVHDFVKGASVPRTYRTLERSDELSLRVRLNYWRDHLDAVTELGLVTNHGSGRLTIGAIKSFSDGSIGGRTAKLSETYADTDGRGTWVVELETLHALVEEVETEDFQVAIHAIGDEAIEETLSAIEQADDPGGARHRIEHVELANDDHIHRLANTGVIASMQPNFLQWAGDGGLYETALGERATQMNRFKALKDAGVNLAFGSDSMPLDPLFGIHCAVNAPGASQRLTVDEAIEAYTQGSAYAGFDEDRLGHLEVGALADCVILDRSPWANTETIEDIEVTHTIVGGEVAFEAATQ